MLELYFHFLVPFHGVVLTVYVLMGWRAKERGMAVEADHTPGM
jgi:hypothetical protein